MILKKVIDMKLKKSLIYMILTICTIGFAVGCSDTKKEEKKENSVTEEVKGNCQVVECIQQLETSNSIEEINDIIGFEGEKSEYSEEYTWKLSDKTSIVLKYAGDSPILQATIDKETVKSEEVKFPLSSELQEMLNHGSFTYEELVSKMGGIEETLSGKTSSSVSYMWVNKHSQVLRATFNNESGKCTIASYR